MNDSPEIIDEIFNGRNPAGDARLIADLLQGAENCPACGEVKPIGHDCAMCEADA